MKKLAVITVIIAGVLSAQFSASAQFKTKNAPEDTTKTETQLILEAAETAEAPVIITLEQALKIALSENISVKVADMEIERTGFAKKGAYAALFPQIDASGAYQRTIKKQVMYMDFDMSSLGGMMGGGSAEGDGTTLPDGTEIPDGVQLPDADAGASSSSGDGIEMGRWNTWSAGVTAAMPLVNAQLWKSLAISGLDVDLS